MPDSAPSQVLLEWHALNAHPHKRSARWYAIGGVIVLMAAAYGLFEGSWILTILVLLMGGMYFLLRNQKPKKMVIRIVGIGIQIEERILNWSQLKDFWILLGPDFSELHLMTQGVLRGEITVFIKDSETPAEEAAGPGIVRELLLKFLPERSGMQERFLDTIARLLKL